MISYKVPIALLLVIPMFGCGQQPSSSQLQAENQTIPFLEWCEAWQVSDCRQAPDTKTPNPVEWQAIMGSIHNFFQSPSTIQIPRDKAENPSIVRLLESIQLGDFLDFWSQTPWSLLHKTGEKIYLEGGSTDTPPDFKGLKISAQDTLEVAISPSFQIELEGLAFESGDKGMDLESVDLKSPGVAQIKSPELIVQQVPLDFALITQEPKEPPQVDAIINSLFGLILDEELDWRQLLNIHLDEATLEGISQSVSPVLRGVQYGQAITNILNTLRDVRAGGQEISNLAEVKLLHQKDCKIYINNIPIIRRITVTLSLMDQLGVQRVSMKGQNSYQIDLYGVDTNLGTVSSVTIEGTVLRIKLGRFTIPIDLGGGSTDGPQIENFRC